MFKFVYILPLFLIGFLNAQEKKIETVYFDFNKYALNTNQEKIIRDFIVQSDTARIESIQIYGYCDDRGTKTYNQQLSENRATTIKDYLLDSEFSEKQIKVIDGKGELPLNVTVNINKIRKKIDE